MCVCVYIYIMFVRTTMLKYMLYELETHYQLEYKLQLVHVNSYCNMNKLYKVPDAACNPNIN